MAVPLTLISCSCSAYSLKRAGHACPAQSPEHVTLGRLPLGQPPFLHRLLGLRLGLVRRLRRYYGSVRLPMTVHYRGASLDFPMRSVTPSVPDSHGLSRLPLKVLACMLGVLDRARSKSVSRLRRFQFCLPLSSTASAPRSGQRLRAGGSISRLNTSPARTPVNASLAPLPSQVHDSEPVWIATPSLYETFIHNTLPAFTGALNGWNDWNWLQRLEEVCCEGCEKGKKKKFSQETSVPLDTCLLMGDLLALCASHFVRLKTLAPSRFVSCQSMVCRPPKPTRRHLRG
jgi:hypothetical protein